MSLDILDTVRVGIVGPSWWVDFWHLPAIQNHPDAEIVAVCGDKERTAADVQAKYGPKARYFTNLEQMLAGTTLDGVIVCTPNDLHHPSTMAALKHGLHVTCEKPMALNAAEAWEMLATARERGLIGMVNFPYRDNPAVKRAHQLVADGYLGTLFHVSGLYHGGFGLRRTPNWRGLRARSGAGILGDLGSHLIDLARYVTGAEFSAVCAHTLTALHGANDGDPLTLVRTEDERVGPRNDDSCAFLAEFESGAQGVFHTSWTAYQGAMGQEQQLELYGTEGRLHFYASHAGTFLRGLKVGEKRWEEFAIEGITKPDGTTEEDEDFFRPGRRTPTSTTYRWIEAIQRGNKALSPNFEDGWRSQQVIDAVLLSSAERRWVPILPEEVER